MTEKKPTTWCYFCQVDSHSDAQCWSTRPKYWSVPTGRYLERIAALEQRLEAAEAEKQQAIDAALNPRLWTKEMSDAWHKALPDTELAFKNLRESAIAAVEG